MKKFIIESVLSELEMHEHKIFKAIDIEYQVIILTTNNKKLNICIY